jgi:hypothetical protein
MFGEEIRWVLSAQDLVQPEFLPSQALLKPQTVTLEVSQLAKALTPCRPHGGLTVRPNPNRQVNARISEQGLDTQANARGSYYTVVLSLAAAEREACLGC